jgi:hypothetical protein
MHSLRTWTQYYNPIADLSKNYIESREVQGDLRKALARRKKDGDLEAGYEDLALLSKPVDSWLARLLRRSCLGWFLIVSSLYLQPSTPPLNPLLPNLLIACPYSERLHFPPRQKINPLLLPRFQSRQNRHWHRSCLLRYYYYCSGDYSAC